MAKEKLEGEQRGVQLVQAKGAVKVNRPDNGDTAIGFHPKKATVTGDNQVSLSFNSAFEDAVVSRVILDDVDHEAGNK